jgi:hypothetical protein
MEAGESHRRMMLALQVRPPGRTTLVEGGKVLDRGSRHASGVTYAPGRTMLVEGSELSDRGRRHAGVVTYGAAATCSARRAISRIMPENIRLCSG